MRYFISSSEEKVINYYVLCNRLKNVIRTGGKDWHVNRERVESIAEHVFGVQMSSIAMKLEYKYDLDIMKQRQTLSDITSRVLYGLESVIKEVKPNIVLVHGDTTTTFAGALAAFYNQTAIGHVEAGLRTNDKYSV